MSAQPEEWSYPREQVMTCDVHGEFSAQHQGQWRGVDRWSECADCVADRNRSAQEQMRRDEIESAIEHAEIPRRYRSAAMESLGGSGIPKLVEWLNRVESNKSEGPLIVQGPPGTGKTFAGCAMLTRWITSASRRSGRYMTSSGYCSDIRRTWSKGFEHTEHQIFEWARRAQFLVLDDLGAGKAADLEILNELIDARYRDESIARTVIVTNIAAANFSKTFGERIADRLRDRSTLAAMTGNSKRIPLA